MHLLVERDSLLVQGLEVLMFFRQLRRVNPQVEHRSAQRARLDLARAARAPCGGEPRFSPVMQRARLQEVEGEVSLVVDKRTDKWRGQIARPPRCQLRSQRLRHGRLLWLDPLDFWQGRRAVEAPSVEEVDRRPSWQPILGQRGVILEPFTLEQ